MAIPDDVPLNGDSRRTVSDYQTQAWRHIDEEAGLEILYYQILNRQVLST